MLRLTVLAALVSLLAFPVVYAAAVSKCIPLTSNTLAQERQAIYDAKIVPDLYIDGFDPTTVLTIDYVDQPVRYGQIQLTLQTLLPPQVYFPPPANDDGKTTYTLIMNDPDEPMHTYPTAFLHWLRKGLRPNCIQPASNSGQDVRIYIPPVAPPLPPAQHRYVLSLLREPATGYDPSVLQYTLSNPTQFNIDQYINATNTTLVASTYFLGELLPLSNSTR